MIIPTVTIGVTSAAGASVPSFFGAAKNNLEVNFNVIAFDANFSAESASIADKFFLLPPGNSSDYFTNIFTYIEKNNIQVLLPYSDEEAIALSPHLDKLEKIGCTTLVSSPSVLEIIESKPDTYDKLKSNGLKTPDFARAFSRYDVLHAIKEMGYPNRSVVVKPARGRGGRGVKVLVGYDAPPKWLGTGRRESRLFVDKFNDDLFENLTCEQIIMPCFSEPVYDVDVFVNSRHTIHTFVRKRLNPAGVPFEGNEFVFSPEISEYAHEAAKILGLSSLHDIDMMTDREGEPVILEVNPRPSGSLAALSAAGYPILEFALAQTAGVEITRPVLKAGYKVYPTINSLTE